MTNASVPQRLRSLIIGHIQTLDHLEVLMLLVRDVDRWWTAQSVGDELRISAVSAGACLEDLSSRMLLDARVAEAVLFRYNPVTDALKSSVNDLARLYEEKPLQVITLVSSLASDPICGLGDAFPSQPTKDDE